YPSGLQQGGGMCITCAGKDFEVAKANFYKRIEELEGKVIGEYIGNDININCICKNGHKCSPTPHNIQRGNGMCITCAGKDFKVAKANFYKRIEELEGKVVGEYTGSSNKVECVC